MPNSKEDKREVSQAASENKAEEVIEVKKVSTPNTPAEKKIKHKASIFYSGMFPEIPASFAESIKELEKELEMPVWLMVQNDGTEFDMIGPKVYKAFFDARKDMAKDQPIALLIHSPGGYARFSYQIASLFRKHCGGFTAVVPRYAKSAATLLSLGANNIIMGQYSELGPLDAQYFDPDSECDMSALDEVQILERLSAFSLEAVDQSMLFLLKRTGKKIDSMLPLTLKYASEMSRPLLEKIDTVHYTQISRVLKVAEEYATRLLLAKFPEDEAQRISRHLVEKYPEHGFIIDYEEAERVGLGVELANPEVEKIFDKIVPFITSRITIIGRIVEDKNAKK